ncbi:MAG: hypothetical protein U5N53_07375, partial [Mycobacterium sp.]|nr:hypothetical protein [Mycobacterium sp.]
MPLTVWPRPVTRSSSCIAISGSSSMMSTLVVCSRSISAMRFGDQSLDFSGVRSRISAALRVVKSSSVVSSSAWRAGGVIVPSRACAPASCSLVERRRRQRRAALAQTLLKAQQYATERSIP